MPSLLPMKAESTLINRLIFGGFAKNGCIIIAFMRIPRLLVFILSVIILVGGGLLYLTSIPRLVEVFPTQGAKSVPVGTPLRLTFSRAMYPDSVQARLSSDPPRSGSFRWDGNTLIFTPYTPWPSGETVTVRLSGGGRSASFIPSMISNDQTWTFTVEQPLLLYLYPSDGPADIYAIKPLSKEVERLTQTPFGVLDFSTSSDGTSIYFSQRNATGGSDIMRLERLSGTDASSSIHLLLSCPQAYCRSPQISPDGSILAFERDPLAGTSQELLSQVWLISIPTDQEHSASLSNGYPAGAPSHPTSLPTWSSTGLLAYYDSNQRAFIILDPKSGETIEFPNETGEAGAWTPDGTAFIAPEISLVPADSTDQQGSTDSLATSKLVRYDLRTNSSQTISQGIYLEDSWPTFSPDGDTMAFARRFLDAAHWTPGRQIWLMDPNGNHARGLTQAPFFNHANLSWNPNGGQLAYIRFNQETLTDPPELWIINNDGNTPIKLVTGGYDPLWIP